MWVARKSASETEGVQPATTENLASGDFGKQIVNLRRRFSDIVVNERRPRWFEFSQLSARNLSSRGCLE